MLGSRSIARAAPRTAQVARCSRLPRRRFQSTQSSSSSQAPSSNSHFAAGVAGGVAGAALLYGIYTFTPAGRMTSKINGAVREADKKYQQAAATIKNKAPSTDEAIDRLRQFCYSYVALVPGGRHYVDVAFKDIETVRETHGEDVDKLVSEAYAKFQDVAKSGLTMEAAAKTWEALSDLAQKSAKLAASAADKVLDNHPQLKDKVGGPINQLKQMGEQYGPEAKKMVDDTWNQIGDVVSQGWSVDSVDKVRKIVDDKIQQMRKFADQAWQKGMEQAKPYLDKNPQVKKLVEENQDLLKQGNATALFKQVKAAVESGDTGKLESYVKDAVDKAKSTADKGMSSFGLGGGAGAAGIAKLLGVSSKDASGKIQQQIGVLSELMNNHSDDGKKLLEETKADLQRVLEDKANKAKKIVEDAKSSK